MSLFDDASLVLTPNGYKASKLYSIKPTSGAGDMVVSRGTTATRVNSAGIIETVAINAPRLDYPLLGGCPSILVEPARTNLVLRSEEFDNASWTKTFATITPNVTTAPDGTMTADKLVDDATLNQHRINQTPTAAIGTYTFSVFLKKAEIDTAIMRIGLIGADFNLTTGTTSGANVGITSTIKNYGNGWYRCSITKTTIIANDICRINLKDSSNIVYTGNGIDGFYLWGAQLELGSYDTSYIPTVASTVTRAADVISKTGISSLIGQTEGTIFWDIKDLVGTTATGNQDFGIKNAATTHLICLTANSVALPFRISVISAAGTLINYTSNITSAKACVKYGTFGAKLFLNGNPTPVATTAVNPNISFDNILFSGERISYKTNSFVLWTTALTDAQCINLTT